VSIDAAKKTLTMTVPVPGVKQTKEETLTLDKDVSVTLSHGAKKESKPGKIEDVMPGDVVTVQLTADKTAIAQISIRPGQLQGEFKAADVAKKTITLLVREGKAKEQVEKTVQLLDDATIHLDDGMGTKTAPVPAKEGTLSDLSGGLVINVYLSGYDRGKAVSVHAAGPTVQGTVKAVDAVSNTITISAKGMDDQTLPISKDVKVGKGKGAEIKVSDITVGDGASLRLSVVDKKTVVRISIQ
jgi:hypothetical protein